MNELQDPLLPPQKTRILFVDDEQDVLDGLRCMLRARRNDWDMEFCHSGRDALDAMSRQRCDVIVTDMRMPGMDGAQLLEEVIHLYPTTIRFVLSGYSDKESIFKSLGPSHQFLAKPCDPVVLQRAIEHALDLRRKFNNEKLKQIISQLKALPGLPTLYYQVVSILNSPDPSIERISHLIEQDMAMSAQVLHLVNSAFFGLRQQVKNIQQSIGLLGLETLRSLVLMTALFSSFPRVVIPGFSFDGLMRHALRVAQYARAISELEGFEQSDMDNAFTAGLLHDVGKLILAANLPVLYRRVAELVNRQDVAVSDAEVQVIGVHHSDAGAYLLGLWGIPDSILTAVACHHHPENAYLQEFNTTTLVHVANAFDHGALVQHGDSWKNRLNMNYLININKDYRLPEWRKRCRQLKG